MAGGNAFHTDRLVDYEYVFLSRIYLYFFFPSKVHCAIPYFMEGNYYKVWWETWFSQSRPKCYLLSVLNYVV